MKGKFFNGADEKLLLDLENELLRKVSEEIIKIEAIKRKEYLTPCEVEALYGLQASTLANQRSKGTGPPYLKIGSKIYYGQAELQEYFTKNKVNVGKDINTVEGDL